MSDAAAAGPADAEALALAREVRREHGALLVDRLDEALPGWVERAVYARLPPGRRADADIAGRVAEAVAAARQEGTRAMADAVAREPGVDAGPAPLQVLRSLVRHPTAALRDLGVPPIVRSLFDERAFPDDVYGLSPATWADVDPSLHEPGLYWGAATAQVHRLARRAEPGLTGE